jgi:hypothetical protein
VPSLSSDMLESFDCSNDNNDRSNGSYNGIEINKPTYITPDHSGLGYALSLRYTDRQYIRITELINLTLTSFIVLSWIYLIEQIQAPNPIFSQCKSYPNLD